MATKLEKTIVRQQEKIAEGAYYEAHQQLRVIASRYIKLNDFESAIKILNEGAFALLSAGQGGSGGDLCLFLLDTYNKAQTPASTENKARLLRLSKAFPINDPSRKSFLSEAVLWSSKFSAFSHGDPELHHAIGSIYAEECDPYEAEKHLVLGTKASVTTLANLEYEWYAQDDTHTAPLYAARVILPMLLIGNLRGAISGYQIFCSRLLSQGTKPSHDELSDHDLSLKIIPPLPLLNFLGLLLAATARGNLEVFKLLSQRYAPNLKDVPAWREPLTRIGELYFGIKAPTKGNPLLDMMGSMLFGGRNPGQTIANQKSRADTQRRLGDTDLD